MVQAKGHCLCGACEFTIDLEEKHFDSCHCSMCRRWSGGPAMAVNAKNGIRFKGDSRVKTYSSSDWADRGFCSECGTHLFYKLKNDSFWSVPFGLLDDTDGFEFTVQVYVDSKPESYEFANKTHMMTEADVKKAFGFEGDA